MGKRGVIYFLDLVDYKVSTKVLQKMYRQEDIKTNMIYQFNFSHEIRMRDLMP